MNVHFAATMAVGCLAMAQNAHAADTCGTITEAELNWASAGIAAFVDKIIMEDAFGCTVEFVESDTNSSLKAMIETGTPQIIPEFWYEGATHALGKAVADKKVAFAAPLLSEGGVQGWWIPKFIADAHPEITTVQQALAHPELFAPAGNKPVIYNCPEGWSCHASTANLFKAFDAQSDGFTLVTPENAVALEASVAEAYEKQYGWLGYYWAPTALLGEYPMVKLSFDVEFDKAEWDRCTVVPGCEDPKPNAYPVSAVYTLVNAELVDTHPTVMRYLNKRSWDNKTVSEVLSWARENKADNDTAARHFLETYPDIWQAWLTEDAAAAVRAKLDIASP